MPDEFSVKLCELVQQHPEVYNIFNKNYHNEEAKNNAWEAIAEQLGVPKSKCVIKWKSLKHQLIKAKKEQNTEWDMWPLLQFCDDAAADKGGSRKRKRESTATPLQMVVPPDDSTTEPRALSKGPLKGVAKKTTTRAALSARTQAPPPVPQSSSKSPEPPVEPAAAGRPTGRRTARMSFGGSLDSSSTGPTLAKSQQAFLSALRAPSNRFDYDGGFTIVSTASRKEATEFTVLKENPNKNVASSPAPSRQQARAGRTAPQARKSTARTFDAETVSEEQVDYSEVGPQPQLASKESPNENVASSPAPSRQQARAGRTAPQARKSTAGKESPNKNVASSPAPWRQQARAGRTAPQARKSTAGTFVAGTVSEEQVDYSKVGPPPQQASKESPNENVASSPAPSRQQARAGRTAPQARKSTAGKESPNKNVASSPAPSRQQARAGRTPPRARKSTAGTFVAETVSEEQVDYSEVGPQSQQAGGSKESSKEDLPSSFPPSKQQGVASRTPRGRRSTMSKESPKKDVVASPQPRSKQQAAANRTPRVSKESVERDEGSPPRSRQRQATASRTPRGRRSTARPALAEVAEEEQQVGSSKDQGPRTKRARIEGNGVGADNQADALMDMKFDTGLDEKFFKILQKKFAKLKPEVAFAKKADIFRMLDEAADG